MESKKRSQYIRTEGVDLSDSLTVHRESTCDKILRDLEEEQVMLIRAPPFSGKTSLVSLLYERVQTLHNFDHAFKLTLLCHNFDKTRIHSHEGLSLTLQELCAADEDWLKALGRVLLIVDEIQMSYDDPAATFFWHTLRAMKQREERFANLFVIMLGVGEDHLRGRLIPMIMPSPRGLELIRFTAAEYAQLVQAFNALFAPQGFVLNERMSLALFNLTLGVPGLTVWALNHFQSECLDSATSPPTESDFMGFLLGWFVNSSVRTRAANFRWEEGEDYKGELRMLLEHECFSSSLRKDDLAQDGILARVGGELQISVPIVRVCTINHAFYGSPKLPEHIMPWELRHFDFFMVLCLERMQHKMQRTIISELLEDNVQARALQMEFFRAAIPVKAQIAAISCPDAGAVFGSRGFLDLYVHRRYSKWVIELTSNGSFLDERLLRFCPQNGLYRFIPMDRWAVINFVLCSDSAHDDEPTDVRDGEIRVLFRKSHKSIKIYRKKNNLVECVNTCFV